MIDCIEKLETDYPDSHGHQVLSEKIENSIRALDKRLKSRENRLTGLLDWSDKEDREFAFLT